MKIKDVMTSQARFVWPDTTLVAAARLMRDIDVGALPVCENDKLSGIITDRDITLRAIAESMDPVETEVREVMSREVAYVSEDQEIEEATRLMEVRQIRRLPVLDHNHHLVGMVSLGDLASGADNYMTGHMLKEISAPTHPAFADRH